MNSARLNTFMCFLTRFLLKFFLLFPALKYTADKHIYMGLLLCCVSFEPASDSHNSGKTIRGGSIFREAFQKALFTPSKLIYAGKWKKEVSFIQKRVRPSQGRHASVSRQAGKQGRKDGGEAA